MRFKSRHVVVLLALIVAITVPLQCLLTVAAAPTSELEIEQPSAAIQMPPVEPQSLGNPSPDTDETHKIVTVGQTDNAGENYAVPLYIQLTNPIENGTWTVNGREFNNRIHFTATDQGNNMGVANASVLVFIPTDVLVDKGYFCDGANGTQIEFGDDGSESYGFWIEDFMGEFNSTSTAYWFCYPYFDWEETVDVWFYFDSDIAEQSSNYGGNKAFPVYFEDFESDTWSYTEVGDTDFYGEYQGPSDTYPSPSYCYRVGVPASCPVSAGAYAEYYKDVDIGTGYRSIRINWRDPTYGTGTEHMKKRLYVGATLAFDFGFKPDDNEWNNTWFYTLYSQDGTQTIHLRNYVLTGFGNYGGYVQFDNLMIRNGKGWISPAQCDFPTIACDYEEGSHIVVGGNSADFGDMSIVDNNTGESVDYWVESISNGVATTWAEIPGNLSESSYSIVIEGNDDGRSDTTHKFSITDEDHDDYGFTYPVTLEFTFSDINGGKCFHRHSVDDSWTQLTDYLSANATTPVDYYLGVEGVRWYDSDDSGGNDTAYVSIRFDDDYNDIFIEFTDSLEDEITSTFVDFTKYYDNRQAAVTITGDDYYDGRQVDFVAWCDAMQSRNIWGTVYVITGSTSSNWSNLNTEVGQGYVEAANHGYAHTYAPYLDYDQQVGDSLQDMFDNIDFPTNYSRGSYKEYSPAWTSPGGFYNDDLLVALGEYNYLMGRKAGPGYNLNFTGWNSHYNLYNEWFGGTRELNDAADVDALNDDFDYWYSNGGTYQVYTHPYQDIDDYTPTGAFATHLDYIDGYNDVWYVGLGAMWMYHYATERSVIMYGSESSGADTFPIFDEFVGTTIDSAIWPTIDGSVTYNLDSSELVITDADIWNDNIGFIHDSIPSQHSFMVTLYDVEWKNTFAYANKIAVAVKDSDEASYLGEANIMMNDSWNAQTGKKYSYVNGEALSGSASDLPTDGSVSYLCITKDEDDYFRTYWGEALYQGPILSTDELDNVYLMINGYSPWGFCDYFKFDKLIWRSWVSVEPVITEIVGREIPPSGIRRNFIIIGPF